VLDKLCAEGLTRRTRDVRDHRRNVTTITAKGRKLLQRLDAAAAQDTLLAPLSQAERRQFIEMLQRLVEHHTGWRRSLGEQARPEAPQNALAGGG
jgi:MarR family transcriptional regulator, lower aerobic nicotinate degradation pathway regulator